jgi:hypothetical protein
LDGGFVHRTSHKLKAFSNQITSSMELPEDPIYVYVKKRSKSPTKATKRENEALQKRVRSNAMLFGNMSVSLSLIIPALRIPNRRVTLDDLATRLAKHRHLNPPDRLARRKKPALICWFCENCPDLLQDPSILSLDELYSTNQENPTPPMLVQATRPLQRPALPLPQIRQARMNGLFGPLWDEAPDFLTNSEESFGLTQENLDWSAFML